MAGNRCYQDAGDLPDPIPVFPLSGALLLPGGQLPLTIFKPPSSAMVVAAIGAARIIGMVRPALNAAGDTRQPALCRIGCLGRLTQFSETGDGRYLVTLAGVTRFRIVEELSVATPYRQCRIALDEFTDLSEPRRGEDDVDRPSLLR